MRIVCVLTLIFLFSFVISLSADTIYLKNGRTMEGLIKSEDAEGIKLDVGFGTVGLQKVEIERISRSAPGEAATMRQNWEKQKQEEKLKEERKPKEADISRQSGSIFVDALLNRKTTAHFMLDTGASTMLITKDVAKKLGINTDYKKDVVQVQVADGRNVNAKYIVLESVNVQGSEAKNVEAAVLLDDSKNAGYQDGLLGMSFLKNFKFKIDPKSNKLILEKTQ